jgi:hypothetical protein
MRLIWHIVKKDIRRFWIGIVLLVGLVGLKLLLIGGVFRAGVGTDWNNRIMRYQFLLLIAELILSFFVAAAIVQEDPVSESGGFWQNLPITRLQLIAAKVSGVLFICALPAVLTLAAGLLVYRVPVSAMGCPLIVIAEVQVVTCLLAFAFGSLARNTAQILYWIIGVALSIFILAVIIAPLVPDRVPVTPGTHLTHTFLLNFICVVACLAVTLNQYLAESRNRSIVFLASGMLLFLYVLGSERSPLSLDFLSSLEPAQKNLDLEIGLLKANVVQAELARQKADSDATELLHISVKGASKGLIISPRSYFGKWMQSGIVQDWAKIYRARDDSLKGAVIQALGFPSFPEKNDLDFGVESAISVGDADLLIGRSSSYAGQIDLNVQKVLIDGQMDLVEGASLRSSYGTSKIRDVRSDGSIIQLDLENQEMLLTKEAGWFVGITSIAGSASHIGYVIVNRKAQSVVTPARTSTGLGSYAYGIFAGRGKLQFVLPQTESNSSSLADWTMVEVRIGANHTSIISFKEDVLLKEVPAINRDAAWTD